MYAMTYNDSLKFRLTESFLSWEMEVFWHGAMALWRSLGFSWDAGRRGLETVWLLEVISLQGKSYVVPKKSECSHAASSFGASASLLRASY